MTAPSRLVLGVIGHVDHGKTALVRALTGTDTDRLPEEKRRGISIALGFAHLAVPGAVLDLIDMPGHERFVRTLVAGASGIDAVLLVVAANEGIKPQTLEHLDIAGLLGVRRAVVALTKAELASDAELAAVGSETAALLARLRIAAPPPLAVSALKGTGLAELRDALAALLPGTVPAEANDAPFLAVDRAFSVAGHGTVVTGTLRGGGLAVGQALSVLPADVPVRVRGLQVHGAATSVAAPGQRVAVNLRGVEVGAVRPGAALSAPGLLRGVTWLSVALRSTASAPPLATTMPLQLLVGTQEVEARLRLLDRDVLEPDGTALAQLRCAEPVAIPARQHLILRQASPPATVAGGCILDNDTWRMRRHDKAVLARLRMLADATPAELVLREAEAAGPAGTTLARLAALSGIGPPRVAALLGDAPVLVLRGQAVVTATALAGVAARIPGVLARLAPAGSLPLLQLRSAMPGAGDAVFDHALAGLVAAGTVRQAAGAVSLVQRDRDARDAAQAARLGNQLAVALQQGGLSPPDLAALAADLPARHALAQLVRDGVAIRTRDRVQKRDLLFHRDAIELARRRLAPLLTGAGLKVTEAGATLGISRKYSVPLLEYLDSIHFTRRVEDRRVLGSSRELG